MRGPLLILVAICSLVLQGCGKEKAAALPRIHASETAKLKAREGTEIAVYGKASKTAISNGSGHHFLNFPDSEFSVMCRAEDVASFKNGGPAKLYEGKLVEISGTIALHKGKPQIVLSAPSQVKVLKDGSASDQPAAFKLKPDGKDTWTSPAGLVYKGRDPKGLTRLEHIMRHARDIPNREGSHGVFDGKGDATAIFSLIDEGWLLAQKKGIRPRVESGRVAYTIPMGRRIGYLGGENGQRKNHPALKTLFIVMNRGTREVITAFPR